MSTVKVEVVGYNRDWATLFEEEAEKIKSILGDELIEIHHIGSTAVENLKAKPIIDIMPVVKILRKLINTMKNLLSWGMSQRRIWYSW